MQLMGHVSLFMNENRHTNHLAHRMKLSVCATKSQKWPIIVEINSCTCKKSQN
jgi:hypothetical protein